MDKWSDLFPLESDKFRKAIKRKPKNIAYATDMTDEEKAFYKQLFPHG